jgi:hypothetical protein
MSILSGTLGALAQRDASKDATKAQQRAADQQTQALLQMYNQTRSDFSPFLQSSYGALGELSGYTPQNTYYGGGPNSKSLAPGAMPGMASGQGSMGGLTGGMQMPMSGITGQAAPTANKWHGSTPYSPFNAKPAQNVVTYGGTGNGAEGPAANQFYGQPQGSLTSQPSITGTQQQYGQPGGIAGTSYSKTGPGLDPTGGASKYTDALAQMNPNIGVDPTGGAGQYLSQLGQMNPNIDTDATGGAQKYLDQLDSLKFELNLNDPLYQWRKDQTENAINQASAARGMYNSRPTINALGDANMALQSSELDRQFNQNYLAEKDRLGQAYDMASGLGSTRYGQAVDNYGRKYGQLGDMMSGSLQLGGINYGKATDDYNRGYGKNMDLYNQTMQGGQANYNKLIDLVKIGQGAAGSAGAAGQNTAQGLSSVYGNMGNANAMNSLMGGQNMANMFGGISSGLQNAGMLYGLGGGFGSDGFSLAKLFA